MSDPGNILWLTENYPPGRGGMSQSCDRIVFGLRERGIRVHLVHFTNRNEPFKTEVLETGTYTSVPVFESEAHTLNLLWNFLSGSVVNYSKMVLFGGYLPMIAGPVLSKWMDLPLITLLRGNDFDISVFNPRRKNILVDALTASETVGCVSGEQIEKIGKLYPGMNLAYTPNGIRLENWKFFASEYRFAENWRKRNLSERELAIGFFGEIKGKKGFDTLLKVLKRSEMQGKFFLVIAGEFGEEDKSLLAESAIRYELLPFLDRNELVKYYAACDAVIIPSFYDGMPNVLLEAGTLGIPVFGSAVGGIKDILSAINEPLLFPPGDFERLVATLKNFYDLPAERRTQIGESLKHEIVLNYNSEKEIKKIIEIIEYEKDT